MSEKPEVKIVLTETHRIRAGDSLFVTVDPQFSDFVDPISEALFDLGVKATVVPLPKGAVNFFAIEEKVLIQMDESIMELAKDV